MNRRSIIVSLVAGAVAAGPGLAADDNAQCGQDKRETKQEGRQDARDIKKQ